MGPVDPNGVIADTISSGLISARDLGVIPLDSETSGGKSWTRTCASPASRCRISFPWGSSTFSVMLRLPVFIYRKVPLRSGWGSSPGNGPRRRDGSPTLGGSTLITSAPSEASSFPQYGAATIAPISSTRRPARAVGVCGADCVIFSYLRGTHSAQHIWGMVYHVVRHILKPLGYGVNAQPHALQPFVPN